MDKFIDINLSILYHIPLHHYIFCIFYLAFLNIKERCLKERYILLNVINVFHAIFR